MCIFLQVAALWACIVDTVEKLTISLNIYDLNLQLVSFREDSEATELTTCVQVIATEGKYLFGENGVPLYWIPITRRYFSLPFAPCFSLQLCSNDFLHSWPESVDDRADLTRTVFGVGGLLMLHHSFPPTNDAWCCEYGGLPHWQRIRKLFARCNRIHILETDPIAFGKSPTASLSLVWSSKSRRQLWLLWLPSSNVLVGGKPLRCMKLWWPRA